MADTSKTTIKVNLQGNDKRFKDNIRTIDQEVHRVQILDPATGTGTFLAEAVKLIHRKFEGQQGIWSNYVENHLLPRLNGFELLMASYAMAHLKLDLLLTETGYKPTLDQRFRVYLTNSLEEHHPDTGTLFANWLSSEANEANHIKRDTPVMVVMGNPPYSVSSNNKSEWIEKLTADYKKDLNERNIQPLSDDYIKFIRFGQHFIDKNGSGILAYISNNSFIDGLIHRQMRKHLLESYDSIYILDLHGNSKKKEVCPDGSADKNVFDIMQGVSINLFVKTGKKKKNELGKAFHFDLFGKRDFKYDFLNENSLKNIEWNELQTKVPSFFLVQKDFSGSSLYEGGFRIDQLFILNASGIKTQRDDASIKFTKKECQEIKHDFLNLSNNDLIKKHGFKDVRDWTIDYAKSDLKQNKVIADVINYRVFDLRYMNYTGKTKGVMGYPRYDVMKNILKKNYSLISTRQLSSFDFQHIFISKWVSDINSISLQTKEISFVFPLYLYPEPSAQQTIEPAANRTPNLNMEIVRQIAGKLGLGFVAEKEAEGNVCFVNSPEIRDDFKTTFAPIDLLDYIYSVLHSPTYREKYKEFLKIDFPRVPYPKDAETFWKLVKLGSQISQIHLLESPVVEKYLTQYPVDGNNLVGKLKFEGGKVYINDTQYFSNVPEIAWNFYIGGYQPAQKWLKDRKDRTLGFEDILHYQKIIVALTETDRLMKEIDAIEIE